MARESVLGWCLRMAWRQRKRSAAYSSGSASGHSTMKIHAAV